MFIIAFHKPSLDSFLSTPNIKNPPPQPTRRSVSTRQSSRSTAQGRVSSVIIHDTDDEDDQSDNQREDRQEEETENHPQTQPDLIPPPRTRKAKDVQTRLGVGRPAAAGGSGARAVTKSQSVSRGKRGKTSKSMKLTEATIPEEGLLFSRHCYSFLFIVAIVGPEDEELPTPSGKPSI